MKNISKYLDRFVKNSFENSSKNFSFISVPNFEAVGRYKKPIIEPVLVMTLVLSYKLIDNGTQMKTHIQHFVITLLNVSNIRPYFSVHRLMLLTTKTH